jgi:chromosome segregation ATPase
MIDTSIFITVVPPIFAAVIAYAIARIKSNANERIQRAKIEAEMNTKALEMVRSVIDDMKEEMKAEIESLRKENKTLRGEMIQNKEEIEALRQRLHASTELQDAMRVEINSLKATIEWYEQKLREVNITPNIPKKDK